MQDEQLQNELNDFPQNELLSDAKKEEMKQSLQKEVGKEQIPSKKPDSKKWGAGLAGVVALTIFVISILSLTDMEPNQTATLTPEEQQEKELIQEELQGNQNVSDVTWSPDGLKVVYRVNSENVVELQTVDEPNVTTAIDKGGTTSLSWSSNSRYIQLANKQNEDYYAVTYYDSQRGRDADFYLTQAYQTPLWSKNGASIAVARVHQNGERENVNEVITFDFENNQTKHLLRSKENSFRVQDYEDQALHVLEINGENHHQTAHSFTFENETWTKQADTEHAEPYSKDYINETLQQNQTDQPGLKGTVQDIEWDPYDKRVIFTEKVQQRLVIKLWTVGDKKPLVLNDGSASLADRIEKVHWIAGEKALVVMKKGEQLNSRVPYSWFTVNLQDQRATDILESSSEPIWGPDGDRIAVAERLQGEYESVIKIYSIGTNRNPQQIYGIKQNGGGLTTLKVASWPMADSMIVFREQGGSEAALRLVKENEEWSRAFNEGALIPLESFAKRPATQSLQSQEPYSLMEETKVIELSEEIKASVHFYKQVQSDPNSPILAYIHQGGSWYAVGEVAYAQGHYTAKVMQLSEEKRGIVIDGVKHSGDQKLVVSYVLPYEKEQGSPFYLAAKIPNLSRLDLNRDGIREWIGYQEGEPVLYDLTKTPKMVSLKEALHVKDVQLTEVNGQEVILATTEDGSEFRYHYNDQALDPIE